MAATEQDLRRSTVRTGEALEGVSLLIADSVIGDVPACEFRFAAAADPASISANGRDMATGGHSTASSASTICVDRGWIASGRIEPANAVRIADEGQNA